MLKKLLVILSLAFAVAVPATAQDWWNLTPWPKCTDGQIYVWSGGGMTCSAQQSLAGYAPLAGATFSGEVVISTELNIATGAVLSNNGTQAAAASPVVITYTTGDPSITPDAAVTIADGATPTVNELLELVVELQAEVDALKAALEGIGALASAD